MKAELVHLLNANWKLSKVLSPISCVPLKKIQLRSERADFCCGRHRAQAYQASLCRARLPMSRLWEHFTAPVSKQHYTWWHRRWCLSSFFNTLIQSFRGAQAGKYRKLGSERHPGEIEQAEQRASSMQQQMSSVSTETQAVQSLWINLGYFDSKY